MDDGNGVGDGDLSGEFDGTNLFMEMMGDWWAEFFYFGQPEESGNAWEV